ncbi:MAG: hypothetical protein M3Q07_13445 [Pseudobdellovibrionaceae bacterium]|nr:hypothetical protein [Pseudobdellovibrionaceae bacterium]
MREVNLYHCMGPFPNKNGQVTINLGHLLDFKYVLSHQTLIFRVKEHPESQRKIGFR